MDMQTSETPQIAEISVHYDAGWGNRITLRGNGSKLNWDQGHETTWEAGNIWSFSTPMYGEGFEFKPMLNDSKWATGANFHVPDHLGNVKVHVYPFFGPAKGSLTIIDNFSSQILHNKRKLRIYLPPSYEENKSKHYPVLYMQDGQNLFSTSTAYGGVEWEVGKNVNFLIDKGSMREVIIVGIDNNADRFKEYTPSADPDHDGGGGDLYLDFVETELMPYINKNYRTKTDRENTLIGGSSLGGLISFYAGWTRSHIFGKVLAMSSSFWWNQAEWVKKVENYRGPKIPTTFYIDAGAYEPRGIYTTAMNEALLKLGYESGKDLFHYNDPNGHHTEASWANRLFLPLQFLLLATP